MSYPDRADLAAVNAEVDAIPYDALPARGEGADVWKDTPDGGDWVCRDYVLLKAERLQALGWPPASLSVVLCWTEPEPPGSDTREYHAVLAVDMGDPSPAILDSRFPQVYPMAAPPADYRWDRRQLAGTTEFAPVA